MRDLIVRPIQYDDLKTVNDLGSLPVSSGGTQSTWEINSVVDVLAENPDLCLVAVARKKILGFIIGTACMNDKVRPTATIIWSHCRCTGYTIPVCNALIEAFITSARSRGAMAISVLAPEHDSAFISIFQKFGFTITGRMFSLERTFSRNDSANPENVRY